MFMRLDRETVVSGKGFFVRRDDVYTLSYHEGRACQPPFDKEGVSPEKKREIIATGCSNNENPTSIPPIASSDNYWLEEADKRW